MNRNGIRGGIFLGAAALALHVLPWSEAATVLPSLSPLLGILGALAGRTATVWTLLGLPILILGYFRSRWFCRYVCPVGFAAEGIGRLNPRKRGRFVHLPNVGRWLLLVLIGGAVFGYPLFIGLDPLSMFTGFFSAWRVPLAWTSFAFAAGFPLVLGLSFFLPQSWCHRVCPLGAAQDGLSAVRRKLETRPAPAQEKTFQLPLSRRDFLGVAAGGAAAVALRRTAAGEALPIRPPGAQAEAEFTGLCARCGACIRACPEKILRPDFGQSGLAGLLTPVIGYAAAHCYEYCNECSRVCPTGAIRRLALETKRNRAIGRAEVARGKCIAWSDGQYCMVCHEFCPYLAIEAVERNGVNCPVVKPDMCRGCGACQVACPALPDKAIVVKGIPQRAVRTLADELSSQPPA
ncbi:MAG: 4Fe-4S binding protein [Lentisphaerae bacterium]|nr:4Fe-4S binding protein [Lentisphaerota bacterium]